MSEFAITLLCTVESMPAPVVMAVTAVSVGPPPFVIVSVAPWLTLWVYVVAFDEVHVMLITAADDVAVIPAGSSRNGFSRKGFIGLENLPEGDYSFYPFFGKMLVMEAVAGVVELFKDFGCRDCRYTDL